MLLVLLVFLIGWENIFLWPSDSPLATVVQKLEGFWKARENQTETKSRLMQKQKSPLANYHILLTRRKQPHIHTELVYSVSKSKKKTDISSNMTRCCICVCKKGPLARRLGRGQVWRPLTPDLVHLWMKDSTFVSHFPVFVLLYPSVFILFCPSLKALCSNIANNVILAF